MKNLQKLSTQKLSKEELKSINAGGNGAPCYPWPLCNGQEVTFYTQSCDWYLYKTSTGSICMEYGAV
ncbi:hypothetical protein [Flavobacterium sp. ov086]|uniref:hypothetical protein n=1 Tax=Flavobacterium sp. ov086 TaxID=1761785 RepID=UPI000B6CAAC4|nr:hypothetical protein [Flavobacterium sp. ov086]SNR53364.1 hypothetical protein SAMN04487979_11046 [Flavobacterium sp. ov086]